MGEAKTKKGGKKASTRDEVVLKLRSDPRTEKRFEPKSSPSAILSVLAFSVAAVLVGAGTYGQWLRDEALGPHKAAPWLIAAGAAVLIATALFGPRPALPIRVGDAGVGVEKGGNEIERIAWNVVRRIVLGERSLTVEGEGRSITISLAALPEAAGKVLREARERIPVVVEDLAPGALESRSEAGAETLPLEPAQVAGLKCKASGRLIAFERDARFCGRCGEVYHREAVPKRCETCDARLK
ncbi:hypothetical protein [Polyangium spumosum]|uniref:Uncharacterized protein n=1 Tax=Polyangium spumosum TaxID=889282 RepID=A0A6N7PHF7_9BACT|nr:hypothetical protein [Polyangium spumosum]MRG91449.1 hypothetical protein [Polyangium spumosum]